MNLTSFAVRRRVIVLAVVAVSLFAGAQTFLTMSRREDPEILIRTCVVATRWPGATAVKVEDLVTDPLEEVIAEIDEVEEIRSQSRTGVSYVFVDIDETVLAVDQLWDEVRAKVDQVSLPDGCRKPFVNSDFGDVDAVVLSLYQVPTTGRQEIQRPYSDRELEVLAEKVKDEIKTVESVARATVHGIQEEVIYLEVDSSEWSKVGLTENELGQLLDQRNIVSAGGEIDTGSSRFTLKPAGEFQDIEQIREVLVDLQDGDVPVRLGDLPIRVRRDYRDPPRSKYRFHSAESAPERCLVVTVTMKSGFNVVAMGEEIQQCIARLKRDILPPDVELSIVNDLPQQVDTLVSDFVTNLWQAIVIVLLVALLMMGWRPAVIMATAVPLCMITSILIVSFLGVELEQFSIASLIIALGMLVDNAIVVSDNALAEIQNGGPRDEAVIRGAWNLAIPILTSTGTTVAAFLPMLTIVGSTGEYIRSLPIVVATTLIVSYFVAMAVTPIMCFWLLRASPPKSSKPSWWRRLLRLKSQPTDARPKVDLYGSLVRWCMSHRLLTMGGAAAMFVASLFLIPVIGNQFFPGGVRNQFFVHVWLPEGSSFQATESKCSAVEELILNSAVTQVDGEEVVRLRNLLTCVGTGGPRLNLTTNPEQDITNYGLIVVNTTDPFLSRPWAQELASAVSEIPGARIDVKPFNLGPAVASPVEFRLTGDDAAVLRTKAEEMIEVCRTVPGVVNPNTDWRNDAIQVDVRIDPEAANLAGVTNLAVAQTMDSLISGAHLTTFREGDHQVDVVLRVRESQRVSLLDDLTEVYVNGASGKVPLSTMAEVVPTWQPAVIARRNSIKTITVGCQIEDGYLANAVAAELRPKLEAILTDLPASYRLEDGGELEETQKSSVKISKAFTLSFFLILLVLIAQYNSVIKPLVVLTTVPLALIGALLGLFVSGWPLGFMPSLGIISLAGVVINNAIILIDFIESNVREGASLRDAIAKAGSQRMKPILLTTLTTVAGMLPLALFGGPMWAGMAWAMIFGLILSTALTLLVVPTIYLFCMETFRRKTAATP